MRRKRLTLIRKEVSPDRTFGMLLYKDKFLCHTLEPGDADVGAPRVKAGFYILEPHGWEPNPDVRYKQTWALVGDNLSHYPDPECKRSAVLIHWGNIDDNTRGCILVGQRRGEVLGEPGVLDSKQAIEELRDLLGGLEASLVIREG
jgi:hypothetical protein